MAANSKVAGIAWQPIALGSLRPGDYQRLRRHLQPTPLDYRQSLYRAHQSIGFVYFIEFRVGSLVNTMANGQAAEVGTIGNGGYGGPSPAIGRRPGAHQCLCPGSRAGLRMKAALFKRELAQSASMRLVMIAMPTHSSTRSRSPQPAINSIPFSSEPAVGC